MSRYRRPRSGRSELRTPVVVFLVILLAPWSCDRSTSSSRPGVRTTQRFEAPPRGTGCIDAVITDEWIVALEVSGKKPSRLVAYDADSGVRLDVELQLPSSMGCVDLVHDSTRGTVYAVGTLSPAEEIRGDLVVAAVEETLEVASWKKSLAKPGRQVFGGGAIRPGGGIVIAGTTLDPSARSSLSFDEQSVSLQPSDGSPTAFSLDERGAVDWELVCPPSVRGHVSSVTTDDVGNSYVFFSASGGASRMLFVDIDMFPSSHSETSPR